MPHAWIMPPSLYVKDHLWQPLMNNCLIGVVVVVHKILHWKLMMKAHKNRGWTQMLWKGITNCSPNVKQQALTPVNTFRILPVVNQDLMIRINSNVWSMIKIKYQLEVTVDRKKQPLKKSVKLEDSK